MPAQKNKSTTKKTQSNQKRNLKTIFKSRRGMAMFLSVFAIGGAAYLISVSAAPYLKPIDPKQIIAGTFTQKPTTIVKDKKTGAVSYESTSSSRFILADGSMICDPGNSKGLVKVGELTKDELASLKKEVKKVKSDKNIRSGVVTGGPVVSNVEGVILADNKNAENIEFDDTDEKPSLVVEFENRVKDLCLQEAMEQIEKEDATRPVIPTAEQAISTPSESLVDKVASLFEGKAYATPSTAGSVNANYAQNQHDLTNKYRGQLGLRQLRDSGCMDVVAWNHAKRMVESNRIYHNDYVFLNLLDQCRNDGLNASTWQAVGENVGRDGAQGSAKLFLAYVASPGHDRNLRNPNFRCMGHGAYTRYDNQQTFHVVVFAAWRSANCAV